MARSTNSFGRGGAKYKPQPVVLVICEDSKSSRLYLEDAAAYFRVKVKVEIAHCGNTDPKGIVVEAIARQQHFDRVFCAIDRDRHENFDEAMVLAAREEKVEIIVSYPCFEFWYLLHFGHNRKPYGPSGNRSPGDNLLVDLRACDGMNAYAKGEKGNLFEILLPKFDSTRELSPRVLAQAIAEGCMNPSTQVHELIDCFEALAEPQLK